MRNEPESGRWALVTGASTGIGAEIARQLVRDGIHVALLARSRERLEQVSAELQAAGGQTLVLTADVSRDSELSQAVETMIARTGRIDILVSNAGIETYCPLHQLDLNSIRQTIDVNLTAAIVLCRLVLPHMLAAGAGHIVAMSSTAGKFGPAYGAAYGASKAGLVSLVRTLRAEYHGQGVSASCVCPGFTDAGGMYERMKSRLGHGTPAAMGGTTATAVARQVVRCLRHDLPEVIVNRPPVRPAIVLAEMFPRLGEWLIRRTTRKFLKQIARGRSESSGTGGNSGDERQRAA